MAVACDLPRRPPLPAHSFLPRTLRRNDVTVPPGAGLIAPVCQPATRIPRSPAPMAGPFPSGDALTAVLTDILSPTVWRAVSLTPRRRPAPAW